VQTDQIVARARMRVGEEIASKMVFICSAMWEPYLKVIREKRSEALRIPRPVPHRG
jgi:hypothetical protein